MKSTFSPNDSNTICDVTGFRVKRSEVVRRWDGYLCIAEAWHPRHPQDYPPNIIPQKTYPDIRQESLDTDDVESFDII